MGHSPSSISWRSGLTGWDWVCSCSLGASFGVGDSFKVRKLRKLCVALGFSTLIWSVFLGFSGGDHISSMISGIIGQNLSTCHCASVAAILSGDNWGFRFGVFIHRHWCIQPPLAGWRSQGVSWCECRRYCFIQYLGYICCSFFEQSQLRSRDRRQVKQTRSNLIHLLFGHRVNSHQLH